jgi:hypothetical protein
VSRGVKQSSSPRYNGVTTLKKKQYGKARTFFIIAFRTSGCHSEELCDCSLYLLEATTPSKSRDEISIREEGYDTPSVTVVVIVHEQ